MLRKGRQSARAVGAAFVCAFASFAVGCSGSSGTVEVDAGVTPTGADASAPPGTGTGTPPGTGTGTPPAADASTSGTNDGGGSTTTPPGEASGCNGAKLLAVPADPGARGPWAVGAKTVTVAGLVTEVWYPAALGSEAGKAKISYDIREHLPAADRTKIPDADNPLQPCDCYRDLPLDMAHGAYPVVQFIHGTAAFRTQSLTQMAHWASRGFVVIASDHPKIQLSDLLTNILGSFGADQKGDATKVLDALNAPTGDLAFLAGHIDTTRIAISGHSAGGGALAGFGSRPGVKVLIPMAAGGSQAGTSLVSTLVMGGVDDHVGAYSNQQSGYTSSPKKKRLVGLLNAGHLAFSDLCFIGRDKGGILKVAQDHGVSVPSFVASLAQDGCKAGQLSAEDGWAIVNYATTGVLEETLTCNPTSTAALAKTKTLFTNVSELQEDL